MSLYSTPATKRGESPTERGLAIIEAAGLALAVLLPSFFNARSTFSFEPDRMALLRVLAIVVAVAGLLTISIRRPRLTPLRLAVIGWLAIQGIATLASVSVGRSFWGSEERVGGLLTSVAWALFALCLPVILSAGAVYRLVAAISLGSVPVTLYALAQEIGWDPVRVAVAPAQPPPAVSSTLGNPVFLGGYLAMVIPLTIWLAWSGQRKVAPIALAVLQMIALIGTEARGPWLGLAAGGVTAMLLIGLATARRRWIAASLAALALGIALLVAPSLALRPESMESLRRTPYVGRLAGLWTSTTAAQRLLIWEGAARLVASDPLRALVGYGPETLPLAYARHYPPRLAEYEADGIVRLPDRAHNLAWDALTESGFLGLAAILALWGVAVRVGLQCLGKRQPREWPILLLAGGVPGIGGAALAYVVGQNASAAGLGLGLGLWGGMVLGLGALGLRRHGAPSPLSREQGLTIALLAALAVHFVDLQVGFVTAATGSLFWLCLAMLAAIGETEMRDFSFAPPPRRGKEKRALPLSADQAWLPALAGLALFAFAFGLTSSAGLAALPLIALAWAALALWAWGLAGRPDAALWGLAALLPLALALLMTWLADTIDWGSLVCLFSFYLAGLVGLGIVAWSISPDLLPGRGGEGRTFFSHFPLTIRRVGVLVLGLLMLFLVLRPAAADVLHKSGLLIATGGNVPTGLAWVTRASSWNPASDIFRYSRARLLIFWAGEPGLPQAEVQARWVAGAQALEAGWQAHPRVVAYAGWLAEYHLIWSEQYEPDTHLAAAEGFYRQGLEAFPGNVEWWTRLGDVLRRDGQYIPAQTAFGGALERAPRYYPAYLGLGDLLKERGNTTRAEEAYRQAISAAPWAPETYLALAEMLADEGRRDEALTTARAALRLAEGHPAQDAIQRLVAALEESDGS